MTLRSMNLQTGLLALGATLLISACGGGGGSAGTPVLGSGSAASSASTTASSPSSAASSVTAASVDLIASAVQVPSGGDQVTITASVKNAGNVSMPAAPVVFSATSGTLSSAALVTDATGAATVILTAGSDRSNRSIVVTATSQAASGAITLPVVGTTLSYSGVTTVALNGTVQTTVTAKDSKGTVVSGLPVSVTSSLGNTLTAATLTTNPQGTAVVGYTASHAGTDTLAFSGGGASVSTAISISGENFAFTNPSANTSIPVGTRQALTMRYLSNGVPQASKTIAFAATAGSLSLADPTAANPCLSSTAAGTALTDSNGNATICIVSTTASPATVQGTLIGVVGVAAQATLPVTFVALTPATVVLQVSPTALSANSAGTTTQQASVVATVTDAVGNPVSGVTVNFNRIADPSGGNLDQASAVTTTGGQASVHYIAGSTSTANNGVRLQATVQGFPTVTAGTASLTVSQSALFIALGTGNSVVLLDTQTYQKDWVVYVTDANGVPVSNVSLTVKALPVLYGKGQLYFSGGAWGWSQTPTSNITTDPASSEPLGMTPEGDYVCANEDTNYNGVLDPAEDTNRDGVLQPGNVISVTGSSTSGASTGIVTTGSTGRATISLIYAKSYANWVKVRLVASAVVSGTESKTQAEFWAAGAAPDYSTQTVAPPGEFSPFGVNRCNSAN